MTWFPPSFLVRPPGASFINVHYLIGTDLKF